VLLVPDADGRSRAALSRPLHGRGAVIGPARPWTAAHASYRRALRAVQVGLVAAGDAPVDTELRLAELVLRADPEALADLRAQVLAPLGDMRASSRDKLVETLRSWLLHHGRRDDVAAELHVHAQTVRYRMGQLRDLYGDRLDDPGTVLALTLALAPQD
jgi:DNA-binding PucR family transcriptional regulator